MEKTKVDITIRNQVYSVTTTDDPDDLKVFAADIDKRVNAIMNNARISINQALVLVALDLENELKVTSAATEGYRERIADYLADAERAMTERDKYKRELEKLKKG